MISLISDTETKPCEAMRKAMAEAEVGDEQRGEDPTVNRLLDRVCDLLQKEAALWLPTGTMCNLVALRTHTSPGETVIADSMAHIVRAESGAPASASGVLIEQIITEDGTFTAQEVELALKRIETSVYPYRAPASLVCIEQTHNFLGGTVWPLDRLRDVALAAQARKLSVHMDGARLFNACCAANKHPVEYATFAETVWIDFTKGLGAPVGAVLAGTRDFIEKARRHKHAFAGAMRQAGIVAAACLFALDHNITRLVEDHENAYRLATGLCNVPGVVLPQRMPQTNIVFFDVSSSHHTNEAFVRTMAERGVRLGLVGGLIRAVTHLGISRDDIETVLKLTAHELRSIN